MLGLESAGHRPLAAQRRFLCGSRCLCYQRVGRPTLRSALAPGIREGRRGAVSGYETAIAVGLERRHEPVQDAMHLSACSRIEQHVVQAGRRVAAGELREIDEDPVTQKLVGLPASMARSAAVAGTAASPQISAMSAGSVQSASAMRPALRFGAHHAHSGHDLGAVVVVTPLLREGHVDHDLHLSELPRNSVGTGAPYSPSWPDPACRSGPGRTPSRPLLPGPRHH